MQLRTTSYRSGFEKRIAQNLKEANVSFGYETEKLTYVIPARKATYTPDFIVKRSDGSTLVVEAKGRFRTAADRQKLILVKETHPDRDIRLVFQNSKLPIYKGSKTTYAMWANTHGFTWAEKTVPTSWIEE